MKNQLMRQTRTTIIVFSVLAVFLTSCADFFESKIPLNANNNSLSTLLSNKVVISKLERPEQFYAAPYYSSTEIRLSWNAVSNAAYYKIEYAVVPQGTMPGEGDYDFLNQYCPGTSYVHEVLKNPTLDSLEYQNAYYYRVSAYNTVAKIEESDPSPSQVAMLFRAPSGLKASGGTSTDYVRLDWEHSKGAEWYEIYKSASPDGTGSVLLQRVRGSQNWYQDNISTNDQGKDFYYKITAQNSFSNKSLETKTAYGYAKVFGAPNAPTNVRMAEDSGRGDSKTEIKIKWDAVDEPGVYYAVYRYSSIDSSLTRLTDKTDKTELSDSQGLKTGIYYYYKIQAIVDDIASGKALKSEFSSPDPEGFIISPPETVIAEKSLDGSSVTVKWFPAIGNENERQQYTYKVYADTSLNGSFSTAVATVGYATSGDGYISATGLSVSNTFFKVATVKGGVVESLMSITVSPAPAAAIIVGATQHAYIEGAAASSSGVYPVKITWRKPDNEEPAFYQVQRSTRTGSGFSRINEDALPANGPFNSDFSYTDGVYTFIDKNETARVGRKYYYRVLSLNQLEQGNFPSDEKIGWGALTPTQYLLEYNKTMGAALKKLTYMHKPGSTEKLGTETKNGSISGTVYYNAALSGLGARIIIRLTNYQEFYIENEPANGVYFTLNGESNTSANMSSNGDMDGVMSCSGMYPGTVDYRGVEIKGGAAGGGTYGVTPAGFPEMRVPYSVLD